MKKENLTYKTRDLFEASILRSFDFEYMGAEIINKDVWFKFRGVDECEKIIDCHINGELSLESRSFMNAQRDMKGIIIKLTKRN